MKCLSRSHCLLNLDPNGRNKTRNSQSDSRLPHSKSCNYYNRVSRCLGGAIRCPEDFRLSPRWCGDGALGGPRYRSRQWGRTCQSHFSGLHGAPSLPGCFRRCRISSRCQIIRPNSRLVV